MNLKFLITALIALFLVSNKLEAQQYVQLSESAKVSLLTNGAWDGVVYALFGHTAIYVEDPVNDIDKVFNYGLFDFDSPNFMFRFVKGETYYSVGDTNLNRYTIGYQLRDISIVEQVLNLTQREKQNIYEDLLINCLPENKVYRYNYFYDNCSTRPRDIIEKNIDGTILYTPTNKRQSYRSLIHECVANQPWIRFGIDLVIGADADKEISDRQKDFIPSYLMNAYRGATIRNVDGSTRNMVLFEKEIVESTIQSDSYSAIDFPLIVGVILLILSLLVSCLSFGKKMSLLNKVYDFTLFFVAGVCGCIIFFLMYFSEHPCTNPNWNIVWLNPFQLIIAFLLLIKSLSKVVYYYHFINFAVLIVFLLAWFFIPQYLEIAFIPYILALIVRSGANIYRGRKNYVINPYNG